MASGSAGDSDLRSLPGNCLIVYKSSDSMFITGIIHIIITVVTFPKNDLQVMVGMWPAGGDTGWSL